MQQISQNSLPNEYINQEYRFVHSLLNETNKSIFGFKSLFGFENLKLVSFGI